MHEAALSWRIQRPRPVSRPSVYSNEKAVIEWVDDENFKPFPSRMEAVRTYLENSDKDLKGAPDAFLQMHWRTPFYRGMVRVVKVKSLHQ